MKAIAGNPYDAAAYKLLASTYAQQGRVEDSLAALRKALMCPVSAEQAETLTGYLTNTNLLLAWGLYGRAIGYQNTGGWNKALVNYDLSIRAKPDYASAYFGRGSVMQSAGDLRGALTNYSTAIRLKANFVEAYYKRGNLNMLLGHLDDARKDYEALIRLQPELAPKVTPLLRKVTDLVPKKAGEEVKP